MFRGAVWICGVNGQGSENTAGAALNPGENLRATPIAGKRNPVRTLAYNALRFASVLIGAGLLMRTASAEYVSSAQQEPKWQPSSQQPDKPSPARLVLPQPAFGTPVRVLADTHRAVVGARARQPDGAGLATPLSSAVKSAPANAERALALAEKVPELARMEAAPPPAANARLGVQAVQAQLSAEKTNVIPARQRQAVAGLLAPVQIVSGPPVVSRAPAVASPIAPSIAASRPTAAEPVQISLAPPSMRPGPRTTALSSDVHAEMRRPASAWDYAEALPPELQGHPGTQQRQAELEPAAPVAAPASAQPVRLAHAGEAVPEPAPRRAQISPAPAEPARVAQHKHALPPVAGSQPRVVLTPASGEQRAPCPATLAAPSPLLPGSRAAAMRVAGSAPRRRLRALERSDILAQGVPPLDGTNADLLPCRQDSAREGGATAAQSRGYLIEQAQESAMALADASGSDGKGPSLRDRIPHPAF